MLNTDEQILRAIEEEFKHGHKLLSMSSSPNRGSEIVKLSNLEREFIPYVYNEVHLLSPYPYHQRTLLYMYVEETIQMIPRLKEEEIIHDKLLHILETLLLGIDYMTHERFISHPFEERHKKKLFEILSDLFKKNKTHIFSEFANRPRLNKSKIYEDEDGAYGKDEREEKNRIYAAVVYKKPKNTMEHFRNVAFQLSQISLKPNTTNVPYEEILQGMTEHQLYEDTLFHLNVVLRTFSWFLNSASWRNNELLGFDEMDLRSKLSIS